MLTPGTGALRLAFVRTRPAALLARTAKPLAVYDHTFLAGATHAHHLFRFRDAAQLAGGEAPVLEVVAELLDLTDPQAASPGVQRWWRLNNRRIPSKYRTPLDIYIW